MKGLLYDEQHMAIGVKVGGRKWHWVSSTHGSTQLYPKKKEICKNVTEYPDMGLKTELQF